MKRDRQIVELSPDAFLEADLEGRLIDANAAACQMLGYAREALLRKTVFDLTLPEDAARLRSLQARLLRREVVREEWRAVHSDGHVIQVEVSSHILPGGRWQAFGHDISERKRIEAERQAAVDRLRESEERFRLIFEEAPIGMALVAKDGRFVRVNRSLCDIVGYDAAELERRRFRDITHPDDLDASLSVLQQLGRGEITRAQLEKRYFRKDGRPVRVMLSIALLRKPNGDSPLFITQIEDIGDRKRAEEALRLSEAKFSGIVSISADAIISIDPAQRITVFNDGAEKIFGYTRSEAIGAPLSMLIPERLRDRHAQQLRQFAAGPVGAQQMGDRSTEIYCLRKNGQEFPAEAAISKLQVGDTMVLTVALRDITERRRVEREQRFLGEAASVLASSLDYESTLSTVAELVVRELADWCAVEVVDETNQFRRIKVASANPARAGLCRAIEQIRIDRSQPYLMRPVAEHRRPLFLPQVRPSDLEAVAQSPAHLEVMRAMAPRSLMALPLMMRDQLLGTIAMAYSSPDHPYGPADLRLAQALADRAAGAIENARLYRSAIRAAELRDQILGIVAHDLRNPLNTILLQATVLSRVGADERGMQRAVDVIQRAATRMNHLIQDLLDVVLIEAGRLRVTPCATSVEALLTEVLELQRPLARSARVDLRLKLPRNLPDVLADQDRIQQVFENLIGNALKFTPTEGRVSVGATAHDHHVLFWVSDTGAGIASDDLPRVFDRFWRAEQSAAHRGAGLGLPVAKGIIEAHQGRIWVESQLGRGTTFFFSLPVAAPAAAQPPLVH